MRLAHLADVHLGYRAYNRVTSQGVNRREADVFQAFRQALAKLAEIQPDLIVIAGDLFNAVRPSNLTIQGAFREFVALRSQTAAPIVIIGGNHDSPRSADTGCILDLFANLPDIHVAHSEFVQVPLPQLDTSVFCLPHKALQQMESLRIEPDPNSTHNILVLHGTVQGIMREAYDMHEIPLTTATKDAWDYIACGHFHCHQRLADNSYYSGSLEFTSTSLWREAESCERKGFIEWDVDQRKLVAFHEVKTRDVVSLRPVDAAGRTVEEINLMIRERVESIRHGHADKIVRLVVENILRAQQVDLDYAFIRQIRAEALHFDLQMRPPQADQRVRADGSTEEGRTLVQEWDEFAESFELSADLERSRFVSVGRAYITKHQAGEA